MKIKEVCQRENLNKGFNFKGATYTLIEYKGELFLVDLYGGNLKDTSPPHVYNHGDFEEATAPKRELIWW